MTGTHAQRTAAEAEVILSLDTMVKKYGAVRALDGVTFDVRRGEMFGLIGPDGAGKTTTIRLLCGLLHADSGTIRVHGHDPMRSHRANTGLAGYLSPRFCLYGDLSVDENIAFFAEIHGCRRLRRPAGSPARNDSADPVPEPARRSALGRHETEARARDAQVVQAPRLGPALPTASGAARPVS